MRLIFRKHITERVLDLIYKAELEGKRSLIESIELTKKEADQLKQDLRLSRTAVVDGSHLFGYPVVVKD